MLPVPTVADLAAFTGRPAATYIPFAATALTQSTLLFTLRTGLSVMPTDPDQALLATNAILQMADRIYLDQPYAELRAKPYTSETIGNYSYSIAATRAKDGLSTGLLWWDLAMDQLSIASTAVACGAIEQLNVEVLTDSSGNRVLLGPADPATGDQFTWSG